MTEEQDANMTEEHQDVNMANSDDSQEGSDTMMNEDAPAEGAEAPPPVKDDPATAKRKAIQAIMGDASLSAEDKRMRIQNLMSGGRAETPPASVNPKCIHYQRNCSIVAPCCNQVFACRVCHDEASPPGHPPMNRFLVREVVCRRCNTRQATSNSCIKCGTTFGEYHCDICNLWMDKSKKPFHCEDCGFCRLGGREAFRHCSECYMCLNVWIFPSHDCFKDKYRKDCPVCCEDMFASREAPQDMPCGHAIHAHCFRKLAAFDYRCPVCKKTIVSQQSMAAAWEKRATEIAEQEIPADAKKVVDIMCNDCETKSHGLDWHYLGVRCPSCTSFNTVVQQVVSTGGGQQQGAGDAAMPDGEATEQGAAGDAAMPVREATEQGAAGEAATNGGGEQGAAGDAAMPDGEETEQGAAGDAAMPDGEETEQGAAGEAAAPDGGGEQGTAGEAAPDGEATA